jgi:hypothetical protein
MMDMGGLLFGHLGIYLWDLRMAETLNYSG